MSRFMTALSAITFACFTSACSAMSEQEEKLSGSWTVNTLFDEEVVGSRKPYLEFMEDDKIAGSTGCNRLGGKAIQSEGSIKFIGLVSTKRACVEQNIMQQERQILNALETIVRIDVDQDIAKFVDKQDNVVMTLSKKA